MPFYFLFDKMTTAAHFNGNPWPKRRSDVRSENREAQDYNEALKEWEEFWHDFADNIVVWGTLFTIIIAGVVYVLDMIPRVYALIPITLAVVLEASYGLYLYLWRRRIPLGRYAKRGK